RGIVRLFCKDVEGKTVLVKDGSFQPYFFAMPKNGKISKLKKEIQGLETEKIDAKISDVATVEKIFQGKPKKLLRITIDNPRKIPDIRNLIKDWPEAEETYEYDIPFYKRYMIDKQIEPANWIGVTG